MAIIFPEITLFLDVNSINCWFSPEINNYYYFVIASEASSVTDHVNGVYYASKQCTLHYQYPNQNI